MSRICLCLLALAAVGCGAANIQPKQYTLTLLIDTEKDLFSGNLIIDAKVLSPGAVNFVLHNNGLNISTVNVAQQGGSNMFSSLNINQDDQYMLVSLANGLSMDKDVQIAITYQGAVSTEPTGLFSFLDNKKKFYMTNFYPIYARKVFPCIDEPGAAANISLNIITTTDIGAPIASTSLLPTSDLPNGYKQYQLSTTTAIAPYSLFFTMGPWSSNQYYPPGQYTKLFLPPSLQNQGMVNRIDPNLNGALMNSNISFFLTGFTNHLNIFVAPTLGEETYSGLNTVVLRQDILIKNLQETTTEMERNHLLKITYALWKMFFGTAVRPADWGNNWLSTSVPMYLAYKILDEPEFSSSYGTSDENLVPGLYEKVFKTSSADDSPVTYKAMSPTKPKEILSFVQSSGVEKGVYALKTIESFVDPSILRSTLFAFFMQQNNTATDTLTFIDFIGKSTSPSIISKSLSDVMLPILTQSGYPLVSLNRDGSTLDMLKNNFVATQPSKFPGKVSQFADSGSWVLPVTVTTSQNPKPANASLFFFDAGNNKKVEIGTNYPENGWALLNLDGKGMMRTSYDMQSWDLFRQQANTTFSPATRAKLVADVFASAEAQVQTDSWSSALKFLEALDSETHLAPWQAALAGFKRMWSWIYHTGVSTANSSGQVNLVEPFKTYVRTRLSNIYQKLGPIGSNVDPQDPLRREIVTAMCEYGDSNCISNLTAQYNAMLFSKVNPSNDLLSVVICNGLRDAKIDVWNAAFNSYIYSGDSFPQPLINSHYSFLACPNSDGNEYSEAINSFLSTALMNSTGKIFPESQIIPAVSEILDKPQHVDQVIRFFVDNQPKFNFSTNTQAKIVEEIGKRLTAPTQTVMLTNFLKDHNVTSDIGAAINASIAAGDAKVKYISSIQNLVQEALAGENPTVPPTGSTSPGPSTNPPTGPTGVTTQSPPASSTKKPGAASTATVSVLALLATLAIAIAAQ